MTEPKLAEETVAEIREGILHGLADVEAGRVSPHDVAMRHVREVIARVKSERAASAPASGPRRK